MVGRSFTTERVKQFITIYEPTLSAPRHSSGQDSAEREQVSPGLLFALKLNSTGWGFHRH